MKIRRILSVFLLSVLLTGLFAVVPAYALNDPAIQSRAALLVDADTGKVLYEKNGFTEQYPASITKVMVALLVLEAVERGELKLSQEITATESSLANLTEDSSSADIVAGETMTVEDLLYCMMLVSANEAGDIFGEAIYGSSQAMVEHMNQRAQELGCTKTHFANTSGLHDPNHYTSCWDIYRITAAARKFEEVRTVCATADYVVPATNKSEERYLHSSNALISAWYETDYLYEGATGIKTGTTDEAGKCLLASAVRGGRTLISVVLGAGYTGEADGYRPLSFLETRRLLDWGFDNFTNVTVLEDSKLYSVHVALSKETDTVLVHPQMSTELVLPRDVDPETDLTYTVDLPESVDAPIAAGQQLGTVTILYDKNPFSSDAPTVTVPLLALSDVPMSRFLQGRRTVAEFLAHTYVKVGLIALAALLVLLVIWLRLIRPRRHYGSRSARRSGSVGGYRGRRR